MTDLELHDMTFRGELDSEGDMEVDLDNEMTWIDRTDAEQIIAHLTVVFDL